VTPRARFPDDTAARLCNVTPMDSSVTARAHEHDRVTTDPLHSIRPDAAVAATVAEPSTEARPPAAAPHTPTVALAAEFRLRRMLGQGGFGEVWEAVQSSLHRLVAVKRMRADAGEGLGASTVAALREGFRVEAVVAANLDHPNIVPVYDIGAGPGGEPLLAMKLVRGEPWDRIIAREFPAMPVEDFLDRHLDILRSVCQAVAFAHAQGVVHRDLKPSQVMVGEFGEVQLADWGLAVSMRRRGEGEDRAGLAFLPHYAGATNPAGTPAYMAPEQTTASAAGIGPHTDVYLLGAILFQLLTGAAPHEGTDSHKALFNAGQGIVRDPRAAAPGRAIPTDLLELAMRAMNPDAAKRPADGAAFAKELDAVRSGATRREESMAIVAEVRARLRSPGHDYAEWATLALRLSDAKALWPANPDAAELEVTCLTGITQSAIDHGDFAFAQAMAERLPEGSEAREEMIMAIGRARDAQRQQRRFRRWAIRLGVLAAVLVAGLMYWAGYRAGLAR
jgi:serine/threonine protein kinase